MHHTADAPVAIELFFFAFIDRSSETSARACAVHCMHSHNRVSVQPSHLIDTCDIITSSEHTMSIRQTVTALIESIDYRAHKKTHDLNNSIGLNDG